jgi:transposase
MIRDFFWLTDDRFARLEPLLPTDTLGGIVHVLKSGGRWVDAPAIYGPRTTLYNSDAIRRQVEEKGAMPNIPSKANRRWKNCFSPFLYRNRNAIERMFCRLKDYRWIATRYDRLAKNFLPAVCIAAAVSYWL